ncbi:hypothetical protein GALL_440090 [mine drainage metagenome]|uniref:Uncharacterized protein n=1 Tax=mine drainage metagenome TaxID=410659 RepID=A0A1J5QEE7_9ZZZZ
MKRQNLLIMTIRCNRIATPTLAHRRRKRFQRFKHAQRCNVWSWNHAQSSPRAPIPIGIRVILITAVVGVDFAVKFSR